MEVAVNHNSTFRIETAAVLEMAEWKATFALRVAALAEGIARNANSDGVITLEHFRQAAPDALKELANEIQTKGVIDANQKAA